MRSKSAAENWREARAREGRGVMGKRRREVRGRRAAVCEPNDCSRRSSSRGTESWSSGRRRTTRTGAALWWRPTQTAWESDSRRTSPASSHRLTPTLHPPSSLAPPRAMLSSSILLSLAAATAAGTTSAAASPLNARSSTSRGLSVPLSRRDPSQSLDRSNSPVDLDWVLRVRDKAAL